MNYVNGVVLLICAAIEIYVLRWNNLISISGIFFVLKYALLSIFVFNAAPSKIDQARSITPWFLFVVSLLAILGLTPESSIQDQTFRILTLSNYLFYSTLFLYSYISLGTSFGLIPEERSIQKDKAYTLARHPIYYFSCLLTLNFLATNISLQNAVCFFILVICSTLRALKEESFLSANTEYADYCKKTPFVSLTGLFLAIPAILALVLNSKSLNRDKSEIPIVVFSDVKFYSISPLEFDDWTSIFIANHLLVDLIQGPNQNRTSACKIVSNKCFNKECLRTRVELKCLDLRGCSNHPIKKQIIQYELASVLNKKNWILPGYSKCESQENICLEFNTVENIADRLNSIYLRVGWSQFSKHAKSSQFGYGSHCSMAEAISNKSNKIILRSKSSFPDIHFKTKPSNDPDISYVPVATESSSVNKININTPIAYYSVSNPKLDFKKLPWNQNSVASIINNHLTKFDFVFKNELPFQVVPKGIVLPVASTTSNKRPYRYKLPNYINDCENLEKALNDLWKQQSHATRAECADLNNTIQDIVLKGGDWSGFLSPLSPGAPYLNSIHEQYFSQNSNDAWVKSKDGERSYTLIGIGRTNLYVNKERICGVQDNYLGLSNLHISDFTFCQ